MMSEFDEFGLPMLDGCDTFSKLSQGTSQHSYPFIDNLLVKNQNQLFDYDYGPVQDDPLLFQKELFKDQSQFFNSIEGDYDQLGWIQEQQFLQPNNLILSQQNKKELVIENQFEDDSESWQIQNKKLTKVIKNRVDKKKKKSQLKNFLPIIKKSLQRLFKVLCREEDLQHLSELIEQRKTSREEFEKIFTNQELRKTLGKIFLSNSLFRELQNSRIDSGNRQLFLGKLNHLKKAFILGKLSNL